MQFLARLFSSRKSKERRIPSSPDLPELWPNGARRARLDVLKSAPTEVLTALCDDYWNSYFCDFSEGLYIRDSEVCRRAIEIIAARGSEGSSWARERLSHPGYDARQSAAYVIGELARADCLADEKDAILRDLVKLAVTPPKEDNKEAQAAGAALHVLSIIGGAACMEAVRGVLTSDDWRDDENQWLCAEILSSLTNESFMENDDPVTAAQSWLDTHTGDDLELTD